MRQTNIRSVNDLLLGVWRSLNAGVVRGDSVAWVEADEVREVAVQVSRGVPIDLPFCDDMSERLIGH